ncbi:PHP domain-containing protein [Herpetosiphon llansteffanensis]
MLLDLHCHTIATPHHSHWTPNTLVAAAQTAGIDVIGIADHNTTSQVSTFAEAAQAAGLHFIGGVEFDSAFNGKLWHTLVYGANPNHAGILGLCDAVVSRNHADAQRLLEQTRAAGHELSSLGQIAVDRPANLADVAHALVRDGIWPSQTGVDPESAGMAYLLTNQPEAYNPLSVAEIVKVAHAAGGVAILAHPGREKSVYAIPATAADLAALAAVGLDGIEVYYPMHRPEQVAFFEQQAALHGFLISAGGDSHGPRDPFSPQPAERCSALLARFGIDVR